jgi:hypothetical protein
MTNDNKINLINPTNGNESVLSNATSEFDQKRGTYSDGSDKLHKGVDYALVNGSPIYAAATGDVIKANYNSTYGNYIIIKHDNGESTLYAHLKEDVSSLFGARVFQGNQIGQSGNTGYITKPDGSQVSVGYHLHFEAIGKDGTNEIIKIDKGQNTSNTGISGKLDRYNPSARDSTSVSDLSSAKSSLTNAINSGATKSQKEQNAKDWFNTFSDSLETWTGSATNFMKEAVKDVSSFLSDPSQAITKIGSWISSSFTNGASDKTPDPSKIDNSNLDLQINTNLTSNFRGSNDLTQSGNAIGDADWRASMKLDVINGDGWKNVAMAGLVTDFNNPARQTISPYETFAKDLGHEVSALESGFANSSAGQSLWNSTQLNVNLSNLANSSINARTFVNIDPVVLDLNGDGVKLTSYNDSQVTFDVDNDGKQERTGWVSSQDGILVHDKNQDGKINNITETISEFCLRVKLCETKTPTPIATPKIETRSMIKSQICCIATYKKTRVRLKSKNFPTTSLSVYEKFPYLNNINSIFKPEHNQQQRKKVSGPDTRHYFLVKKYLSVRCRDLTPFLKKPIAANQLNQKQKNVLNIIIKNCPEAHQIKIKP